MNSIYDAALGYEIAFSYRDVPAEVDALVRMAGRTPESALEIAAGPAEHAVECARRGWRATALDLSPAMCARAAANAAAAGVPLDVVTGDMLDFRIPEPVDLAFCMISSISYVLTLDQMVGHLTAVRRALRPGGCYIIEGSHPTEYLGDKATQSRWTQARDGIEVDLMWGAEDDVIDPVTQITQLHVEITVKEADGSSFTAASIEQDRFWTRDEMHAAAVFAGMRVDAEYGDFDGGGLADPGAWRMICVLRPAGE